MIFDGVKYVPVGRDALIALFFCIDKHNYKVYNPNVERKEAQK